MLIANGNIWEPEFSKDQVKRYPQMMLVLMKLVIELFYAVSLCLLKIYRAPLVFRSSFFSLG